MSTGDLDNLERVLNRNGLLQDKRQRLLLAVRQTYLDFFHDYFIDSDHIFHLRVIPCCKAS